MKMTRLPIFALFVSVALTSALLAKEKQDEETGDSESEVSVTKMTLVRDAGKDFQPVKKFKPSDIFGVLVQLSEAKEGTKVKVSGQWSTLAETKTKRFWTRASSSLPRE
ncbi:MAG: hypothetical protein DME57_08750 [Verrucomicrobia bacterium]|nr:MAG: hypothetical protein DME57_08750 [Verrucomicrobiota bacterium]